jgi:hypothetical protein
MDLLVKTKGVEGARPKVLNEVVFGNTGGTAAWDVLDHEESDTWADSLAALSVKTENKLSAQEVINGAATRQNVFAKDGATNPSPNQEAVPVAESNQPGKVQPTVKPGEAMTLDQLQALEAQATKSEKAKEETKPKNKGGRPKKVDATTKEVAPATETQLETQPEENDDPQLTTTEQFPVEANLDGKDQLPVEND